MGGMMATVEKTNQTDIKPENKLAARGDASECRRLMCLPRERK